ncbi:MAG: choice-of-anchor D domain-containing protein, partial [Syntrophothermus sp.]
MKFFTGLVTLIVLAALGGATFGGTKYAIASGNWTSASTWSDTRGGAPASAIPATTDDVVIPAPFKVTVDISAKTLNSLTVESGAALFSKEMNPLGSQIYLRIYGDFVKNDGIIGYDPAKGPDSLTTISFEAYKTGGTLTFSGSGVTKISRLRNGSSAANVIFVMDQDLTFSYQGSTGSGGMGFYPQTAGCTFWVKPGRTVTCIDKCNIGVASSTSSNGPSTTFTIDGTLKLGASSTFQLMPQTGAVVSLTVNGTLEIPNTFKPTGTAGDTSSVIVNAGGVLKLGSATEGSAQFTSPNQVIRGLGSVQLNGGTIVISNPAGLNPVNGHIRTAARTFAETAGYTFAGGKAAMSTGSDFPAKAAFLTINDTTGTVTLTNDLTVDSLNLALGNVATGAKKLTISPTGGVLRTNGYVIGNLVKSVAAGAAAPVFEVGTANGYSPVSLQFGNVTTGGTLTVSATETVHPNAVTAAENLKRYWTVANSGIVFNNYSASFTYLPADFNTGVKEADDEANLTVNKYTASAWSQPGLGTAVPGSTNDGGSIQATGLTTFGDFAIAKKAVTPPAFVENFTGAAGTVLTTAGWVQSGTSAVNPITIAAPGLSFPNYIGSGIGNAAPLANNGQDVYATFPAINSGSAYLSFLINPSAVLTGDYIIALSATATQSNYMARLHVKSSGSGYVVGISKNNEVSGGAQYGSTVLPLNQTSLVVVKYNFLPADTLNDAINVYVFPSATPASEPATADISGYTNNTKTDAPDLGIVTLRQGSSSAAPTLVIDGVRVSSSWDIYTASAAPANASFSTKSVNFGTIKVNTTKADSVTVTNTGAVSLAVDSVVSSNTVFTVTPSKAAIAGSAAQKFTLTFAPKAAGTQTGTLIFYHNGTSKKDTVQLTGATEAEVVLTSIKDVRADANNDFIPDNL